ncbi:helicase [Hydrogenivirga caldilitoris]|uniref:Helicase n=1 Tax=Hydrogenivirga caldilitoris TaxID=246264 RepID=A0A497XPU0_9AQUI|nr:DEAD/DEAH box helicase [Hydrogenivirga caldilitoris]RLJ70987.1 helicase [Hydrogenivirga caldilitoris]
MKHYLVLESSEFSIDPPGGMLLYKTPAGKPIREELVEGRTLDERVPFKFLNPIQTLFFKKYRKGNALVTAPTSAGKSLIAFAFMKGKKGKKVYTAPTKSLVYEKALELKGLFGERVDVRTGDIIELYKTSRSEVVVATYENLALALRNKLQWVMEAGSIVIDEVHHLMGSRGWVLEEIITHLLERGVELLGLSATLPGSVSLAKWIKAELFIESFWRPVPLERKVIPLTEFREFVKVKEQDERLAAKLLTALYELKKPDEQVILFVHKKNVGWKVLELANREKIGVMNETVPFDKEEREEVELAFHNADIPKEEREEIERAFRKGELPVLVATHTLAYGVNLPADTVMIGVRAFYDRREGKIKVFPSQLDILQMEGRAGRLGIKEKGYSYLLPYGAKPHTLEEELRKSLEGEFTPYMKKQVEEGELSEELEKVLSLFVLIGFLYEGKKFRNFLKRTFSLKEYSRDPMIDDIYEWLEERGYIENNRLSDKALFCIRSGMSPINYEEFLRRKLLRLDKLTVVRPLLFVKRFDGLYEFVKRGESFPEDEFYIRSKLAPCGGECFADNTDQFLFYIEGLTFKYRNIQNPPGEFSYLGTDALHLLRILLDIRSFGDLDWSNEEILRIAHSVKYGLTEEYSSLGGIKGIGHIRANLLKRLIREEALQPPPIGGKTKDFIENLNAVEGGLERRLADILERDRYHGDVRRVEIEVKQVIKRLEGNREGVLIDDRILRTFGLFSLGPEALSMKKESLLSRVLG